MSSTGNVHKILCSISFGSSLYLNFTTGPTNDADALYNFWPYHPTTSSDGIKRVKFVMVNFDLRGNFFLKGSEMTVWLMYSNVQNLEDWSFFHVKIHNLHQPVNISK